MKKLSLLFFFFIVVSFVKAQTLPYDFSAINDDGITLYYKIIDESNKEVAFTNDGTNSTYATVTKMIIPDKVKDSNGIEYTVTNVSYTFYPSYDYPVLRELTLPNTLRDLGWQPFLGLSLLEKLIMPTGLETHNGIIFQFGGGGASQGEIYLRGTTPPINIFDPDPSQWQYPAFNMDMTNIDVYVPIDCTINYKSREDWRIDGGNGGYKPIPYQEQITLSSSGYATLYLENENFEVPTGCTAYIIKGSLDVGAAFPDAIVEAFGAGKILPAKTAFILENLNEKGNTIGYRAHVSGTEEDVTGNLLVGSATEHEFSGGDNKYYVFSEGRLGLGFYYQGTRKGESIKVKAHRSGLKLPTSFYAPAKSFFFDFETAKKGLTTKLKGVTSDKPTDNSQDIIYDLQGRRIQHPRSGIYIINKRKQVFN